MPQFSDTSLERLATCHPLLKALMHNVIRHLDFTVLEGARTEGQQNQYFLSGKSKLKWPDSKHCSDPERNIRPLGAEAVDIAPWVNGGVSWNPRHCVYLAGYVQAVADRLGISIRWGGNWDRDGEVVTDQTFQDLVHFELVQLGS